MDLHLPNLNPDSIPNAIGSLLKNNQKKSESQKPQLFEPDDFLYLILTLKKIPTNPRTNPYKIPLPHPFHLFDSSSEFCLIIDDRPKSNLTSAAAKKKIQSENIPISKVLKLSKLKSDYRPFEAKRKLCNSYNMFFADKRVIHLLPRLLGKEFFRKKKIPVPVDLTRKRWKEQIEKGCESALLFLGSGTCSVLKVGKVSQGKEELVENAVAAVNEVAEIIPKKWGNVRALHFKLTESVALPVYQTVPDVGLKIEGVKEEEVVSVEEVGRGNVESGEEEKVVGKKKVTKKGRIHEVRYMDELVGGDAASDEDEDEGALGWGELVGTKRKKADKKGKKEVLEKKEVKVKKGDGAKKKKDGLSLEGEDGENGLDGEGVLNVYDSSELKKKKKKKKTKKDGLSFEGEDGENEIDSKVVRDVSDSSELKKKKKKKSKVGKTDTAEIKMKRKKSKRSD